MYYNKLSENISIVIVGDFIPSLYNPLNLIRNNVIEIRDIRFDDAPYILSDNNSVHFKVEDFDFFCDRSKMQIISNDISKSDKMVSFIQSIFLSKMPTKTVAVGINAEKIITFNSAENIQKFYNHFSNPNAFMPFMDKNSLLDLTIQGNVIMEDGLEIKQMLSIRSQDLNGKLFVISINNHINSTNNDETIRLLKDKASELHLQFDNNINTLLKSIV